MNVADLLDAPVHDAAGRPLGVVVDVRLALEVVDEPGEEPAARENRGAREVPLSEESRRDAVGAARVVGLLVGPRGAGSFHGYERSGVRSPWPVAQLLRRRHRGTYLVLWRDVAAVDVDESGSRVHLVPGHERFSPELDRSS
jgi:hypothetical protein